MLNTTQVAQKIGATINIQNLKKLLHGKRNLQLVKRQPKERDKVFVSYTSSRGLAPRIHKELKKKKKAKHQQ